MNHQQLISEIQDRIKDRAMTLSLDGLSYLRPTKGKISKEGITTDPGDSLRSDFYSFEELPESDLQQILSLIDLEV